MKSSLGKVIVTGGGGFLGKALCLKLLAQGAEVISIARGAYPDLAKLGVTCFREDIAQPSATFSEIFDNVSLVFHTAAKVDMWGSYSDFYAANVQGTHNIVAACQSKHVPCLVYTSSPSVIANGSDLQGVDESQPYPDHYKAYYPQTKALAEQFVLASNSQSLYTCALRPHLIWGPGDTNLIPTVLERARAGRLIKIGRGNNLVDFSYIEDCVSAHICAARALLNNSQACGKAYFISQGDPMKLWEWIDRILQIYDLPAVTKSINPRVAYFVAWVCEQYARLISGATTPLLTRFLVEEMATDHYFNISQARTLLGYQPAFSMQAAFDHAFGTTKNESTKH